MRLMTPLAFIAGYAAASYSLLERYWVPLSPEAKLMVAALCVSIFAAGLVDKFYVTPKVRNRG